jgi:GNAT superfamily N-acetyltransferase
MDWAMIGGALAIRMTGRESLLHNRVIGLGVFEPATAETLDAVRDYFAGVDAHAVNLPPLTEPSGLHEQLRGRGYASFFHHVKWARGTQPAAASTSTLRVKRVSADQAATYGELAARITIDGLPAHAAWSASHVGLPGWQHYLALDGDTPVANAALHVSGGGAWLGAASTLESHRGRGAQGALLSARITDAIAAGAKALVVETGPNWPELDPVSYRNVERAGFQVAYERPSWIFPMPA